MKQLKVLIPFIFLLFPFIIKAQVMPTLVFNPDPQSFGMGMSGVSLTTNDPLGFYVNPAKLGYSAQTNNLSFQFNPQKTNWTGFDGYKYSNSGISAGYNFSKLLNGLNLSAGVGFISSKMDYVWSKSSGRAQLSDWVDGYDKFNALGLGVSLDYFVNIAIGLTYKSFNSKFPQIISEGMSSAEAKGNAIDWGLLLNIPVSKLTINDFVYKPIGNIEIKPTVNLAMGYSKSNIGKEIYYVDPSQGEPLPLTARLGYTLSLGADMHYKDLTINFVNFDFTVEAEDLMINYTNIGNDVYLGGAIKPWQNLIELKQTGNIILRKGLKLSLFESVSFLFGSFQQGNPNYFAYVPYYESFGYSNKTNGIIFSTNGLFKLLLWDTHDNPYTNFILRHFEVQYISAYLTSNSKFSPHDLLQTDIHTVSVSFNRFTF